MTIVYKLCPTADWDACRRHGTLPRSAVDASDGFIHLSTAQQVQQTAAKHYRGQADLWLLGVQTDLLPEGALRWELSRGDEPFPHLYGDLPRTAVVSEHRLELDDDGVPAIAPDLLEVSVDPDVTDEEIVAGIADVLPVGIWVARAPNGEFVYANEPFKEIMGMAARDDVAAGEYAQPYGIHTRDGRPYPESQMPFVRALTQRKTVMIDDIVIHRTDGRKVYVRAYARPVFAGDDVSHVVIGFIDISREVVAERDKAESDRKVQAAQRMESIGTLAGGIAHDFNNLLGVVLAMASMLRSTETDDQRREDLQMICDSVSRASELTRSLLGFAGRGVNLAEPIAIDSVVDSVLSLAQRAIGDNVRVEPQKGARRAVRGDRARLEQVVMNLLLNARDAVGDTGRIQVSTRDDGDNVVLEVRDDGPGVDDSIRHRVFDPYFTTKTDGPTRGTGLGLATAYGIVDAHAGRIELVDTPAPGALFRVTLPATPGEFESSRAAPAAPERMVGGRGRILVVDDESAVRRAARRALEVLGYQVSEAADGLSAVQTYGGDPTGFAAVLLDLRMPGLDGRETYLALREIDAGVRVLIATGHAHNAAAQAVLDLGAQGFIEKPFDIYALSAKLASVLE